MNRILTIVAALSFAAASAAVAAGEPGPAPKFAKPPTVAQGGGKTTIDFAVTSATDVEVAILDAKGGVVRHLAAGVLGAKEAPPAPLKPGLAQSLEWDGKDDYGEPPPSTLHPQPFSARVRIGMGVKLEKIVGGDPYAWYSREMGQGDHSAWAITGLEAKPDGSVYVMGLVNNYGPVAIRQYDALGNFRRTVYPPPAGKPAEAMKGWGVDVRPDGTYAFQYGQLEAISPGKTLIFWGRAHLASLVATPEADKLTLLNDAQVAMTIGTDGTLPAYQPAPAFSEPKVPGKGLSGSFFSALSPDRKTMYVSGLFACDDHWKGKTVETGGFWRDGQVWKVDVATRKAEAFFALDEKSVIGDMAARGSSPIADNRYSAHGALAGVAVDAGGNVFVCDRQNQRIVVLDKTGKQIREIPGIMYPDDIAVSPKSKALYVTTRWGNYASKNAEATLLKFNDWSKDDKPAQTIKQCPINWYGGERTFVTACEQDGQVLVWFAYTTVPVRIYRDKGADLEPVKDFYESATQRALDLQHMVVDQQTESVYFADGFGKCFRVDDWKSPGFARLMVDGKTPLSAVELAVDARGRLLYAHPFKGPVVRYRIDGGNLAADPVGGSNVLTEPFCDDWRIRLGIAARGMAIAPDGSLANLGAFMSQGGSNYKGYLNFFKADPAKAPWQPLEFKEFNADNGRAGGLRFDNWGNLYAGKSKGGPIGTIYKYAPTGSLESGNLFPKAPDAPTKVYEVRYGAFSFGFSRQPRFGVDGWGRIYCPNSLEPRVSVIDNEGNPVLAFGTWGNRDSMGGLPGDLVPTRDVPMAYPNSVDATDDYVYVSEIVNSRLLRMAKTFAAAETVGIK